MKPMSSHQYRFKNNLQVVFLISIMLLILGLIGWLIAGEMGVLWSVVTGLLLFVSIPKLSPHLLLSLNGAKRLGYNQAPEIHNIVNWLSEHAGLEIAPDIYFIPRNSLLAYSVGKRSDTAIAISNGLLNILTPREITAVLAHEISHISHNDIVVMQLTQIIHLITSLLAIMAYFLVLIYIPVLYINEQPIPWLLLIILLIAPDISVLILLTISRLREFDADMEAITITGDPMGLASALQKLEGYEKGWLSQFVIPRRKLHIPKFLNTHPPVKERIKRLIKIAESQEFN